jgi:hypothetical protein
VNTPHKPHAPLSSEGQKRKPPARSD